MALNTEYVWMAVGFIGQAAFGSRFLIQWIATERKKRPVVPTVFWHLSIIGTILVLAYSIYLRQPVFIAGYSLNMLIYLRNLYFIYHRPVATEGADG